MLKFYSDKTWPIKRPRPLVPLILELLVKMIDPENIFQQKPVRWKKSSSTGSAEIGITCDPEKADFRGEQVKQPTSDPGNFT